MKVVGIRSLLVLAIASLGASNVLAQTTPPPTTLPPTAVPPPATVPPTTLPPPPVAPATTLEPAPADIPSEQTPPGDPGALPPTDAPTMDASGAGATDGAGAPAAEESMELSAAELAELGLTQEGGGQAAVENDLKIYGFADFTMRTVFGGKNSANRGSLQRHPSFYIGNFNLYMSKNITEKLRMFGEVRFTFLPNGAPISGSPTGEYVSTATADYADANRPLNWAGIEIERVYLEWAALRALTIRAGVFLTPYGIWNVDHGSPAIVTVDRPYIIGSQFFPERQTGFEVLGRFELSAHNGLGYHLTLSNGMGPTSITRDLDSNKAVGGRLYWTNDSVGELRIGGSIFYGRDTNSREATVLQPDGMHINYRTSILSQSDVLSLAADLRWTIGGLLLQSEFITQQRKYTEAGRVAYLNPLIAQNIAPKDSVSLGAYALVGYRFEWMGIMPYFLFQKVDETTGNSAAIEILMFNVGLNVRPLDAFVFKAEYSNGFFPNDSIIGDEQFRTLQFQFAWAF
jgi:hypothetical protein